MDKDDSKTTLFRGTFILKTFINVSHGFSSKGLEIFYSQGFHHDLYAKGGCLMGKNHGLNVPR